MTEPEFPSQPPSPSGTEQIWARMFGLGCAALAAVLVYFLFSAQVRVSTHLYLGLIMIALSLVPALSWAHRGSASLPVFETLMLTGLNTYALPLLNGHQDLLFYSTGDVTTAALGVIVFQIAAIVVYRITRAQPKNQPFWRQAVISKDIGRWLSYGIVLNTAYVILSTFTAVIPEQANSVLRAVFYGVGIICIFINSRRMGMGELSSGERVFFFANLFLQCVGAIATLFLVGAVSLLLLTLVGYVSGSGRLPIVIALALLVAVAVLHHGKAAMREKYWTDTEKNIPTISELPEFFTEWIGHGLNFSSDEGGNKLTTKLIERTSLFQIMCLVVSATPAQQPYLYGETYWDIPAQFVPRILWANKPPGHVSTSRLSVYYGLQTEEDTEKTTIGFGMLAEAYSNFGFVGLAAIGSVLAFGIKKIQGWAADGPLLSYGGLLLIILLAWSFQVEFTLSIWLASLYQACIAVLGLPYLLRRIFP